MTEKKTTKPAAETKPVETAAPAAAVKAAEVKAETKPVEKKAEVKAETKPVEKKAEVKAETKPVEKKAVPAKKAAEPKAPAKKAPAKKTAEPKTEVFFEFEEKKVVAKQLLTKAEKAFAKAHKDIEVKELQLYVNGNDGYAYLVVYGKEYPEDKIEL